MSEAWRGPPSKSWLTWLPGLVRTQNCRGKQTVRVMIRIISFDWSQVSFWASAFSLWQKFSSGRLKHSLVCKLCNCQTFCTNPEILTFHNILSIQWDIISYEPDCRMIRASRLLKWILETFKMEISHLTTLNVYSVLSYCKYRYSLKDMGNAIPNAIPNFATEKEPKRNFLYFTYVTLVVVDIKSERFRKGIV